MKILHMISGLGPGGAENLLLDLAAELKTRGIEQKVIYFSDLTALVPRFAEMGIETEFIDHPRLGFLGAVRETRRAIKRYKPSVVHTNLLRADILGRTASLLTRGMRCVSTIHNMDVMPHFHMVNLFARATVNNSRRMHLVAVAECCRAFAIEHVGFRPDKITTISNFAASRPGKRGAGVSRAALGLSEDDLVLINVGRLEPQKCQMDILRAAEALRNRGVDHVHFLILGEGSLRPELEAYIKEHDLASSVTLIGYVENVYDYFDISSAFLLTSAYEGASVALLEAFGNRLPAISTDIPSTREMLDGGAGMLLYPYNEVDALVNLLLDMRGQKLDVGQLADQSAFYAAKLTPERYVDQLLAVYRGLGVEVKLDEKGRVEA